MRKYINLVLGACIAILIRGLIVGDFHIHYVDWIIGIIWGCISVRILEDKEER